MSDLRVRELERQAAAGDPDASRSHAAALLRAGGRDPRRHPIPGDVVEAQAGPTRRSAVTRRIVACPADGEGGPLIGRYPSTSGDQVAGRPAWRCRVGWTGANKARCSVIHYSRVAGRGPRGGTLELDSWRAWCQGGEVLAIATKEGR